MGPKALLPLRRKGALRIFITHKNPPPSIGFEPVDPVAITLTTRPPRACWTYKQELERTLLCDETEINVALLLIATFNTEEEQAIELLYACAVVCNAERKSPRSVPWTTSTYRTSSALSYRSFATNEGTPEDLVATVWGVWLSLLKSRVVRPDF
jgi:hypothetical protein